MLKDPKLLEHDKKLFEVSSKNDLRERSHGDPDHEGEKAKNKTTASISSSAIQHTPTETSQQNHTIDLEEREIPLEGVTIDFLRQLKELAMSDMLDLMNPEPHVPKEVYIPDDNTTPLPVFGPLNNMNLPARYFFNYDLDYLQHGKAYDEKYTLPITKYHATPYDRHDIKEDYEIFARKVIGYNK
ncbi:hypothetical protein Tco_0454999 [Tanacetum coccineum]